MNIYFFNFCRLFFFSSSKYHFEPNLKWKMFMTKNGYVKGLNENILYLSLAPRERMYKAHVAIHIICMMWVLCFARHKMKYINDMLLEEIAYYWTSFGNNLEIFMFCKTFHLLENVHEIVRFSHNVYRKNAHFICLQGCKMWHINFLFYILSKSFKKEFKYNRMWYVMGCSVESKFTYHELTLKKICQCYGCSFPHSTPI